MPVRARHSGYINNVNPLIDAKLQARLAENPIFCATCGRFIELHDLPRHIPTHRGPAKI